MTKEKTHFVCQQCGAHSTKWNGRCPDCGEWNSMVEEREPSTRSDRISFSSSQGPQSISSIRAIDKVRQQTGIGEFDRILGGGAVVGSVVLVGGDPGIGKSTLLLQACEGICRRGLKALYVTGEESTMQTKVRAERLAVASRDVFVMAETNIDTILDHVKESEPDVLVVDSIQMMYKPQLSSAPGSVSQVRECAMSLVYQAKSSGTTTFLIGHVTKDGAIAGPRVLEHMVDAVLYFEGDRYHTYRVLRAVKNRFGSTNEIGIFEMRSGGLAEVENPSRMFLSEEHGHLPGSVVSACMEGTRPLLVEVQALVSRANFGTPERKVTGVEYNRICMLMAVLEKRGGLQLGGQDVFVNAVGGVQIGEPACDLAAAVAIASSFCDCAISNGTVFIGEIGLAGEVRAVSHIDERTQEAGKLGFTRAIVPRENLHSLGPNKKIKVKGVSRLAEALNEMPR